jgi:outer membrane lipoprotein-sorting protein
MKQIFFILPVFIFAFTAASYAQDDATLLVKKVKAKLDKVNDYEAAGEMKTNISFMKVPAAQVKVYFKKPGKIKIKNEKGISLVPKGTVSISLNNLLSGQYQALDAGTDNINGQPVKVIKLLPLDDNGEVVLSKLYIDVARLLILRAKTTTRESGTNELEMSYGKFTDYALPDKIVFSFSTQDYKLPKGVTFDYDDGSQKKKESGTTENQRGKIEITYSAYIINKGVSDDVFK